MTDFLALVIGAVGLCSLVWGAYTWVAPGRRWTALARELFTHDEHRASAFLPGEKSWTEGHGLALWRSKAGGYAVVRRGSVPGLPTVREPGLGRFSIVMESQRLEDAVGVLTRMRTDEERDLQRKTEERERLRAEKEAARKREVEETLSAWAALESRADSFAAACVSKTWRPALSSLPAGVSRNEAWGVVSESIDVLVESARRSVSRHGFQETRTLVNGFSGASDWSDADDLLDESLLWTAVLALLDDIIPGRDVAASVLSHYVRRGRWELVHGLAVEWARIESDQLDRSAREPLVECAAGALVKWWRLSDPVAHQGANIPVAVSHQLNQHLAVCRKHASRIDPLKHCAREINRIDAFVLAVVR